MKNFSELPLCSLLKNNLDREGFITPTPVQSETIEPAMAGRDMIVTAQTGTGKTLAFVLPMIERLASSAPLSSGIRAVVLSPTRELAIQIQETFMKMAGRSALRATVVVGGVGEGAQLSSIRKGAQVLIATPGRMYDFFQRNLLNLNRVELLVLDEADRMLDMGFLPTIEKLIGAMPVSRQTLLFSATIESSVKHLIDRHVRNAMRVSIGSVTRPHENVALHAYEVEQDRKLSLLGWMLQQEEGSFLVFARTKHGADRLAKKLSREGVKAAAIHGDRTQNQRNQALRGFQDRSYRVLVATDVAARGIHVDGISHVVNYDLPQVPEDFIHRIGRTGRAGARGTASTFVTRGERGELLRIEKTLKTKLVRRSVSSDLAREENQPAPLMVMPMATRQAQKRSFAPRGRKSGRRVRRAV